MEGVKIEESQIREQLEKSGADLVQNKRTQKGLLKQQEQLARLCLTFNTLQQTTRHSKEHASVLKYFLDRWRKQTTLSSDIAQRRQTFIHDLNSVLEFGGIPPSPTEFHLLPETKPSEQVLESPFSLAEALAKIPTQDCVLSTMLISRPLKTSTAKARLRLNQTLDGLIRLMTANQHSLYQKTPVCFVQQFGGGS